MSLKYDCGSDLSWEIVEQFSKFPVSYNIMPFNFTNIS